MAYTFSAPLTGATIEAILNARPDWNATTGYSVILNKPTLFSGSYVDLTNKPTIPAAQVQSDWNASTGLGVILNKPTIPAAQVQSDWTATTGMGVILNKPSIPGLDPLLTTQIGVQNNSTNYFCVATFSIPKISPYEGGMAHYHVYGQGNAIYDIYFGAYSNASTTGWDSPACTLTVSSPFGTIDGDTFNLVLNWTAGTAKLYYRHPSAAYNLRLVEKVSYFTNAATFNGTYDSVGVATLPTSDFAVTVVTEGIRLCVTA